VEGYAIKFSPSVIVINSTIVPGTTRSIERSTGIPCVYSPVRGKHTKMVEELQHYVKFVAGTDAQATARVQAHFKAAGIPLKLWRLLKRSSWPSCLRPRTSEC